MKIDWLKKIECSFSEVAGVVIDANHTTKTDIHTTQKTQYVQAGNLGGVRIQTPEIHSSHTDHNRFWIETPAGEHIHLNFENLRHPPIVGQSVVLLSAKVTQDQFKKECRTALVNKSARKVDYLHNPLSPLELRSEMDFTFTKYLVYLFWFWVVMVSLGGIWNGTIFGDFQAFLFFLFLLFCSFVAKVYLNKIVPKLSKQSRQNKDLNSIAQRAFTELENKTAARCKEILER